MLPAVGINCHSIERTRCIIVCYLRIERNQYIYIYVYIISPSRQKYYFLRRESLLRAAVVIANISGGNSYLH